MTSLCERVDLGRPHRAVLARIRHAIALRVTDTPAAAGSGPAPQRGRPPGAEIRGWATAVMVAVTALHLYQVRARARARAAGAAAATARPRRRCPVCRGGVGTVADV